MLKQQLVLKKNYLENSVAIIVLLLRNGVMGMLIRVKHIYLICFQKENCSSWLNRQLKFIDF